MTRRNNVSSRQNESLRLSKAPISNVITKYSLNQRSNVKKDDNRDKFGAFIVCGFI